MRSAVDIYVDLTLRQLTDAKALAARGMEHIARQRAIIELLQNGGYDTTMAESLLATFLDLQVTHERHVDRLRGELGMTATD